MPGWTYYDTERLRHLGKTTTTFPTSCTYDLCISREQYDSISEGNRHLALLKAMVLDDGQIVRYSDILTPVDDV